MAKTRKRNNQKDFERADERKRKVMNDNQRRRERRRLDDRLFREFRLKER